MWLIGRSIWASKRLRVRSLVRWTSLNSSGLNKRIRLQENKKTWVGLICLKVYYEYVQYYSTYLPSEMYSIASLNHTIHPQFNAIRLLAYARCACRTRDDGMALRCLTGLPVLHCHVFSLCRSFCDHRTRISSRIKESSRTLDVLDVDERKHGLIWCERTHEHTQCSSKGGPTEYHYGFRQGRA